MGNQHVSRTHLRILRLRLPIRRLRLRRLRRIRRRLWRLRCWLLRPRLWLWLPILGLWCWLLRCWLWRIWRRILPLRLRIPILGLWCWLLRCWLWWCILPLWLWLSIWRRILPLWLWLPILLDRPRGDQSDAVVRMIHAASGGVVWHHQKQICSIFLRSIEAKGETRLTETRSWCQNTFVISVLYWCCKTRETCI